MATILRDGREHDPDVARITYRCRKCLTLLFITTRMDLIVDQGLLALPKFCPKCTDGHPEESFK